MASFAERLGAGLPLDAEPLESDFVSLDERVRKPAARGLVRVRAHASALDAIAGHVERRLQQVGRRVVRANAAAEDAWGEVALRLGLTRLPAEADACAHALIGEAERVRGALVVPLAHTSAWDHAVTRALAELDGSVLVVLISGTDSEHATFGDELEVPLELDGEALGRWWDAVASARRPSSLRELDEWLDEASRARRTPSELLAELGTGARELFGRMLLVRRALPRGAVELLGESAELERLLRAGLCVERDGVVSARQLAGAPVLSEPSVEAVSRALVRAFPGEAWALAKSAELQGSIGHLDELAEQMFTALGLLDDDVSRAELWGRFATALQGLPGSAPIWLRGAELALELGDADVSLAWAQRAGTVEPRSRAALVLGRASLARGDLVSALAALARACELSEDTESRAAASVHVGEVRYAMGDLAEAEAVADRVLSAARTPAVRLAARNLLGKLLLAKGEWAAADAHFASDECDAIGHGELTAELRARVNRAVALLSRGASESARSMLESVLTDAEARGERRAVGFALSNLAVLAIERHDYGHALALLERTIGAHRRLGDRLNFARDVSNLVELRLRLGLYAQAEQVLRFGKNALGPGAPGSRAAELALAAAHVHLCRGRTLEAEREVRAALRSASMSSDGDKLGECHRLAARIALEDGAVQRAETELARAQGLARSPYDRAEVRLLEALLARALGRPARRTVEDAVAAAHEAGDEELARQAHVLAAELALDDDDAVSLRSHLASARSLADDVVQSLSGDVREAYLARTQLVRLARLERLLAEGTQDAAPVTLRAPSEPPRASRGAAVYVGRHPSVRAMLDSLAKVGKSGATVLIHGESGTGKELVSELIHVQSNRAQGPLVKLNCAALVESLLLSELFGHEKGAFTGASSRRRGRFERANGGTLFLDEIGDISPRTQVALLRVLEERRIERVGGSAPIEVDVRIVCATHRDLRAMVERGEFREDLYYRLSGISLEVPALRERLSDLPLLGEAILERVSKERGEPAKRLGRDALELLGRHRWPGNVRELENALRAVSVLSDGEVIEARDLAEHVEALRKVSQEPASSRRDSAHAPRQVAGEEAEGPSSAPVSDVAYREIRQGSVSLSDLKRNIERECIERALADAGGNITKAATLLGMKRPRLSQLVKQYGFLVNGAEDPS